MDKTFTALLSRPDRSIARSHTCKALARRSLVIHRSSRDLSVSRAGTSFIAVHL